MFVWFCRILVIEKIPDNRVQLGMSKDTKKLKTENESMSGLEKRSIASAIMSATRNTRMVQSEVVAILGASVRREMFSVDLSANSSNMSIDDLAMPITPDSIDRRHVKRVTTKDNQ